MPTKLCCSTVVQFRQIRESTNFMESFLQWVSDTISRVEQKTRNNSPLLNNSPFSHAKKGCPKDTTLVSDGLLDYFQISPSLIQQTDKNKPTHKPCFLNRVNQSCDIMSLSPLVGHNGCEIKSSNI